MNKQMKSAMRWIQTQAEVTSATLPNLPRRLSASATNVFNVNQSSGGGARGGSKAPSHHYNKNWIHPPDALSFGRVDYTVKFLGEVEVSQPKGADVVREAIQKINFQLQVKKSSGHRIPRVEIQINVENVRIMDPRDGMVLYRYPLHRISFCADDKHDRRVFSFIAKDSETNVHRCFVFLSDKLAEEITLTVGQAFDLAFRKFRDNSGKKLEMSKQIMLLRKRIRDLEAENSELKSRLAHSQRQDSRTGSLTGTLESANTGGSKTKWETFSDEQAPPLPRTAVPPTPPVSAGNYDQELNSLLSNGPDVGRRLENLDLGNFESTFEQDFNPRAGEPQRGARKDVFGLDPFFSEGASEASGSSGATREEPSAEDLEQAISVVDTRLAEMKAGFSGGLSMAHEDFQIADFDPLNAEENNNLGRPGSTPSFQ